jgi:ribosome-binding protein aMBF1 (putative translation factor)
LLALVMILQLHEPVTKIRHSLSMPFDKLSANGSLVLSGLLILIMVSLSNHKIWNTWILRGQREKKRNTEELAPHTLEELFDAELATVSAGTKHRAPIDDPLYSSPGDQFGKLLRDFRERAGLSQGTLASLLKEKVSKIKDLEAGKREPPREAQFYQRLRKVPGFTDSDIARLLQGTGYDPTLLAELYQREDAKGAPHQAAPLLHNSCRTPTEEEPQDILTESSQTGASISEKEALNGLKEYPLPIHYPHSMPEHGARIVEEGKWEQAPKKGVVYQSSHARLLFEALENPNHKHRHRAVQLVRRFNKAVEKEKAQAHIHDRGIVIQQASQKYGISATILRDWEEMGLIPVLYKGKGKQGVYLDEAAVARATTLYQEAKQKGIQPTRFLKAELAQQAERRPQLDQGITANSAAREFNVPTNFLLRWAKELGVIPIVSEGTGAGSATYLDREKAKEAAELYHEAKRQKIQPIKLLERLTS